MIIRWSLIKTLFFGISFFTLFFGVTTVSRAETKEEGMYFSILGVENSIGGDFDGKTNFKEEDGTSRSLVPEIDTDTGFGILIGSYNDRMAGEISYLRSVHETNYYSDVLGTIPLDGEVELINFDLKLYAFKSFKTVKPYFLFGLVIPRIIIDNGAFDGSEEGDAIYKGYGLNLGLGTEIRIHDKVGIEGSAVLRGMKINRIEILGKEFKLEDSFIATGSAYSIKLNYYF